jgi:hypothetical protein
MRWKTAGRSALLLAASLAFAAAPAAAADPDLCRGQWVRTLGGPHAVLRQPMTDVASLQSRLPELEASIRTVIGQDASLGPAVADAVIAAIRDGSAIRERQMLRDEPVRWMAYQPEPGRIEAISPACLRLRRNYDAFEITVEVPDPAPVAQAPECAITATRTCTGSDRAFTVDLRGSSPGARVTMAVGGQPETAVEGSGQFRNVQDPGPYDLDTTFTVRVEGGPAPARSSRAFSFLMPGICGNLVYLGEAPGRTLPATETLASCEESVLVERCAPATAAVAPLAPVVAAVDRCEDGWVLRPFLFGYFPTGNGQRRDIDLPWTGPANESFEVGDGYGVGLSLERRMGPVFGLEAALLVGRGDSEYTLTDRGTTGSASHGVTFQALTVGPNFHMLGCRGADLYFGPFVGYGGFADPNYWVGDHRFVASFDRRFLWGAQIGLDVPFRPDGPWGFHGGLRYMDFSQDTDAGSLEVDPLLLELGLSYRF